MKANKTEMKGSYSKEKKIRKQWVRSIYSILKSAGI